MIKKGEGLVASRKYCPKCNLAHNLCECEAIEELNESCQEVSDSVGNVDDDDLELPSDEEGEQQASLEESFDFIKDQFESMGARVSNFIGKFPTWLFTNRLVSGAYMLCNARKFLTFEKKARRGVGFSMLSTLTACTMFEQTNSLMCGGIVLGSHALMYGGLLAKWRT